MQCREALTVGFFLLVLNQYGLRQPEVHPIISVTLELFDLYKSKQGNTTNLNILLSIKMKKSCSGGTRTHNILLARQMLYHLSLI